MIKTMSLPTKESEIRLTLDYPPSLNALYATVNGRRVLSKAGRDYKVNVAKHSRPVMECPVIVSVDAYRPRKTGDLDNTLKALLDSLTGVIWKDDKQVVEIRARRFDDAARPRVEVTVMPA